MRELHGAEETYTNQSRRALVENHEDVGEMARAWVLHRLGSYQALSRRLEERWTPGEKDGRSKRRKPSQWNRCTDRCVRSLPLRVVKY